MTGPARRALLGATAGGLLLATGATTARGATAARGPEPYLALRTGAGGGPPGTDRVHARPAPTGSTY